MHHVVVVEAAEHVENGVAFAYVGQELVSEAFSVAGTLHQTCDVHYVHRGRAGPLGLAYLREPVQPAVGHVSGTEIWFDGAEREVGALGLA